MSALKAESFFLLMMLLGLTQAIKLLGNSSSNSSSSSKNMQLAGTIVLPLNGLNRWCTSVEQVIRSFLIQPIDTGVTRRMLQVVLLGGGRTE